MEGELLSEIGAEGVYWITLNRPTRLNAMTAGLMAALVQALEQAEGNPAVVAVAITGSGRAFCSGGDMTLLKELQTLSPTQRHQLFRHYQTVVRRISAFSKPVIAAVNGTAAGAGFDLALSCDLIFAAESASFTHAFAQVGLISDMGGSFHLPRLIGLARAKEIVFGCEPVSALRAEQIGLVNAVVADGQLVDHVTQWAAGFRRRVVPGAVAAAKLAMHNALVGDLGHTLEFEAVTQSGLMDSPEHKERIQRFLAR